METLDLGDLQFRVRWSSRRKTLGLRWSGMAP